MKWLFSNAYFNNVTNRSVSLIFSYAMASASPSSQISLNGELPKKHLHKYFQKCPTTSGENDKFRKRNLTN
jgi:hypothetical protein